MTSVLILNRLCAASLFIIILSIVNKTISINLLSDNNVNITQSQFHDIVAQFNLSTGLSYGAEKTNNIIKPGSYFTHLAYDKKRNVYYAGATNIILQLNENLRVLKHAITGPKSDSPQCHTSGCTSEVETQFTNNYNKILVVTHSNVGGNQYGSIYGNDNGGYGFGGGMWAQQVMDSPQSISLPLAANDENSTTYAFVGPSNYHSWNKEDVLYVGTTFTNVGEYRHDVPAISSRKLDDLNYAEFSIQQSILNIDVKYRDHFLVDYIYGFNTSEHAYFLMVQKKSHLAEEAGYITRIARICISDSNYDSYTEITIQCQATHSNVNYNILRDAKITTAGQKLARQLEIKTDDIVLVAAFSPSKEITNQPQDKSAVCIYSLKEIEDIFLENIHMCFNGTIKDRNLGYISVAALKNLREPQLNLQIGFILDNVETVKDMSKHFQDVRSTIVYVDDPNYFEFPNYLKLYKGDTLVIEGEHLNIASDETDVNVTIGTLPCNVTSLAMNQLVCTPPEKQPSATDENGVETSNNLPLVVVRVGRSLRFPIGYLKYDLLKTYSLSNAMLALGICSLFVFIALVIMILFVYRRKSTQAEREYKRIQIQMDTLESNVRLEASKHLRNYKLI
uniref:Sema domain-containing protein n=1 Tax=Megaselia scalaris TaxID=36166 RepID=T1GDX4_MEGSC